MTNYQKFNQNDYLPNLTHINSLLSSKNQQPLQQLLSPQAYTVLIHLINKLNPQKINEEMRKMKN